MAEIDSDELNGGCACGEVRYHLKRAPMFVNCCHCSWCQRETGASFALNSVIETCNVDVLQGKPELIDTPSSSGKGQQIARCPKCHVALWSHYAGAGHVLSFIRTGTLDNPGLLKPGAQIFTSTKQPWVVLPDDMPAFEEYYDLKEVWSAESLARRDAAFK